MDKPEEPTVETSALDAHAESSAKPSDTGPASKGTDSTDAADGDSAATSPVPAAAQDNYSTDLFRAFPKVCQKAKSGVQLCQAVAVFVVERAGVESAYAQSLLKIAHNAKAEDWAKQLEDCWSVFQDATEQLAQERWAFASTMQSGIVPGAKAFALQQETQVQRLIAEGTKVRWAQQQMTTSMEKAKEKYERKCAEAAELTAALRKTDSAADSNGSPSLSSSSWAESTEDWASSKELTEKLTVGAGQLLTKMWDTTSSFGRSPVERQRIKLYSCLEEVISAEKHYLQTVDYTNAQRLIFEREIKENLHAFQLTEEQRVEYLKDVLVRMQKAFVATFERSQQHVERMKETANAVNEIADIEHGFQSLGSQEEIDVDRADLASNPFYQRMMHIQAMSDSGQRMIGVISTVVTEFIAVENRLAQSLRKLIRTHENAGMGSSADLFGTSSPTTNRSFLSDEGASMTNGWQSAKDQIRMLLEVHQEFRSLLAEPVSLSLSTMKTEYESVRVSTQEKFLKSHSSLCNESSAHSKLQHKLETKSRDFAVTFSYLPGATAINSSSYGVDTEQALESLGAVAHSFNEKERRAEARLRHLAEEIRQLQSRVAENSSALKQIYQLYIQEIEVFISVYMKNEKYRLQVGKNSLQSLAKAMDHMLHGSSSIGNKALATFEKINPNDDIADFIRTNKQPYERSKRIVPVYHGHDGLKEVMRQYLQSKTGGTASAQPKEPEKHARSPAKGQLTALLIPEDSAASSPEQSPSTKKTPVADVKAASVEGGPAVEQKEVGEDKITSSGIEQNENYTDEQPLGMSDFQKKFKLDAPEQVVESYSCALYLSNFPFHGRLYLTRDCMCFAGWRDTIFVARLLEISAMEKKNTALIVPNAIELVVKGEKVFFASFVFRDECFQCIQQLRAIKKETEALLSDKPVEGDGTSMPDQDTTSPDGEPRRRSSPTEFATVSPNPETAMSSGKRESQVASPAKKQNTSPSSQPAPSPSVPNSAPEKDELLSEFEVLVDEEAPFSVDAAYSTLWIESDDFSRDLLEAGGSTDISLPPWKKKPISYTAINTPESFDGSRSISYTHHKKYMVGPSTIPTTQTQRYAYKPGARLVVSVTTSVSDVPYCDYFRVEQRWVFSATKKRRVCLVQVGVRVQWLKSTWLKKQIESTTISEAKDSIKAWVSAAIDATQQRRPSIGAPVMASASTSKPSPTAITKEQPALEPARPRSSTATKVAADSTSPQSNQLRSTLQLAIMLCALVLIYTMYRVCTTMDKMHELTRETLLQQQQQQAFLKDILLRLQSIEKTPSS